MALKEFGLNDPYVLGTAVVITFILDDTDTLDTCKITIWDSCDSKQVNSANMTKSANKVYTYTYQSDEDDEEGKYTVQIDATSGSYTTREEFLIHFVDTNVQ